jgi:RNA polymerase sigma-70 factor (ECF subfamily)
MTDISRIQDNELITRISRRDETALSLLYQQYGNAIFSLALRVTQNYELAQEVTQDTFYKVWHQSERWNAQRGKLIVWLLAITRNTAIDYLRREQRQPQISGASLDELAEMLGRPAQVDDPNYQDRRLMTRLMSELPPEQAHVIRLAFYQGLSHSEIAETLNLPLGTVKTRVRLGLQKLRALWLEANSEN